MEIFAFNGERYCRYRFTIHCYPVTYVTKRQLQLLHLKSLFWAIRLTMKYTKARPQDFARQSHGLSLTNRSNSEIHWNLDTPWNHQQMFVAVCILTLLTIFVTKLKYCAINRPRQCFSRFQFKTYVFDSWKLKRHSRLCESIHEVWNTGLTQVTVPDITSRPTTGAEQRWVRWLQCLIRKWSCVNHQFQLHTPTYMAQELCYLLLFIIGTDIKFNHTNSAFHSSGH